MKTLSTLGRSKQQRPLLCNITPVGVTVDNILGGAQNTVYNVGTGLFKKDANGLYRAAGQSEMRLKLKKDGLRCASWRFRASYEIYLATNGTDTAQLNPYFQFTLGQDATYTWYARFSLDRISAVAVRPILRLVRDTTTYRGKSLAENDIAVTENQWSRVMLFGNVEYDKFTMKAVVNGITRTLNVSTADSTYGGAVNSDWDGNLIFWTSNGTSAGATRIRSFKFWGY